MLRRIGHIAVACVVAIAMSARAGTVVNDTSLGSAAVIHSGNIFTIGPSSGKQVGTNLFYSLSTLNLDKGETADFVNFPGSSSVQNVLTRITGGQSTIDGTLECDIPSANFFLINSAGVVFGPDSALNVQGSFTVTTADQVKLADGKVFAALPEATDATLTTAAPAAFGFIATNPASITVNGGAITTDSNGVTHLHPSLNPPSTASLTVVAGNITINGGELATTGASSAVIVSVASPGIVNLSNPTDASSFSSMGTLTVEAGGLLGSDASSNGGVNSGPVTVVAGNVMATGTDSTDSLSSALGSFSGTGKTGPVSITVTGPLTVNGGAEVGSDATNLFNATNPGTNSGNVTVSAGSVTLGGADVSGSFDSLLGSVSGYGKAGSVAVTASGALDIHGGAKLVSDAAFEEGTNSGSVTASAQSVTVGGADASESDSALGSFSGSGQAGSVEIMASSMLLLSGGAEISSDAFDGGGTDSGLVSVSAGNITIGGADLSGNTSEIVSLTGTGNGGAVQVTAQTLSIIGGGEIAADAFGTGQGGAVSVTVGGAIQLDGGNAAGSFTGISSESLRTAPGGGNGGNVAVSAGTLSITGGAEIEAGTSGAGKSGNITVTTGTLAISNAGLINASTTGTGAGGDIAVTVAGTAELDGIAVAGSLTGIGTDSELTTAGGGAAGRVTVFANALSVLNGANIEANTFGTGAGGDVNVGVAGAITIDGVTPNGSPSAILAASLLSTPGGGKGGHVSVSAGMLSITNGAEISASTDGTGGDGNVNVTVTGVITISGLTPNDQYPSGIFAETISNSPNGGSGGAISVRAEGLSLTNDGEIAASTFGTGAGGNVNVSATGAIILDGGTRNEGPGIYADTHLTTAGGGNGGIITVSAGTISIANDAEIAAASNGTGQAGGVLVTVSGPAILTSGGALAVSAPTSIAGSIALVADSVSILGGAIKANAGLQGGNIDIQSANLLLIQDSKVTASSGNGGAIVLDPPLVVLDDSTINGLSNGSPVKVVILAPLLEQDASILTDTGQTFPEVNLSGLVAPLPQAPFTGQAQLEPTCEHEAGPDQSSFVVTGSGGLPPAPGGWFTTFDPRP